MFHHHSLLKCISTLIFLVLLSISVRANPNDPPEKSHTETWYDNSGDIIASIQWWTKPIINTSGTKTHVSFEHQAQYHVNNVTSITNRIKFSSAKNSLESVKVLYSDGLDEQANRSEINVKQKQIMAVISQHKAPFDVSWQHYWTIQKPTQSFEQSAFQIKKWTQDAHEKPRKMKLLATKKIVDTLKPHGYEDEEVATINRVIDVVREREILVNKKFDSYVEEIDQAENEEEKKKAILRYRDAVFRWAGNMVKLDSLNGVDLEEARRMLEVTKYASQAYDDIQDMSFESWATGGGDESGLQKFLNVTYGVTTMAEGVENQDAQRIMSGLRNSIGEFMKVKVPKAFRVARLPHAAPSPIMAIVDLPGSVAATITNVSAEGMNEAEGSIRDLTVAFNAETQAEEDAAIQRAIEHSKKLERIVSKENYGSAILNTVKGRLIDKVPGLRAIVNWWGD